MRPVLLLLLSTVSIGACDTSDGEPDTTADTVTGSSDTGTETPVDTGTGTGNTGTETPLDTGTGSGNTGTETPLDTGTGSGTPGTETPVDTGTGTGNTGTETPADTGTGNGGTETETPMDTGTNSTEDTGSGDGDTADSDSDSEISSDTGGVILGEVHSGGMYHLGPVDFAETDWHNACAPGPGYRAELLESTGLGGEYLAGVANAHDMDGGICDACIRIDTAAGKSIVARVVTYGVTTHDENLDVSPSVYDEIHMDEWPRDMSWQLVSCPETGPLYYEFQTEANIWWTSLWVRNPKVLVDTVEVKSSNHSEYYELSRGGDGTFTDASGFGDGPFTLRITAIDGQVIEEDFDGFETGELVESEQQFE